MTIWLRLGLRCVLWGAGIWGVWKLFPRLFPLVAPFVLALLPVWWLNPAVTRLHRRLGGPRGLWAAVLLSLLFTLTFGSLVTLGYWLAAELKDALEHWPLLLERLSALLTQAETLAGRLKTPLDRWELPFLEDLRQQLTHRLQTAVPALLGGWMTKLGAFAMAVPSLAIGAIVFFLACCFLLSDYPRLYRLSVRAIGPDTAGLLRFIKHTASGALGGWLRAQLLLSAGVLGLLLLGFFLFRQEYVLLPALVLTLVDFLPLLGAGVALVPWAGFCFLTGDPRQGMQLLLLWGAISLFRRVAEPRLVGQQTGLPPILTLLGIYAGMKVAGVAGMILGPIVLLVILELGKAGVFDGLRQDVRGARVQVRRFFRCTSSQIQKNNEDSS